MIGLTHPVTGHEIKVDGESVDFWKGAGYRESVTEGKPKAAPRKRAAKKSSTTEK